MEFVPLTGETYCLPIACTTIEKAYKRVSVSRSSYYYLLRFFQKFSFLYNLMFYHLKRRGIVVFIWVLNEEEEFNIAYMYGASGLMTDYPSKAAKYFKKRNIKIS